MDGGGGRKVGCWGNGCIAIACIIERHSGERERSIPYMRLAIGDASW